ncbi:AI-2E family transporter [uncultured Pontibacter sp.]|uniref:AI-2E family transporter n=1 Tax=uncultured Pontibacter sp. TaxID=453356 RepID=UPI002634205B|nr:AI-2E family transporter [uncultured Pontibacter sp.]
MQDIYTYARRIALAAFIFFLVAAAFYLFIQLTHFLLLVFAGILLAVLFTSLSEWVSAKIGFGRGLSLTIVTILLFGMLVGLGFIVAPTVGEQVNEMGDSIPQAWEDLKDKLRETTWGEQVLHEVENGTGKMIPESKAIFSRVTNMFTSTLSIITDLLIVLITGLFLAANPLLYTKGFVKLFPVMRRNRVYEVLSLCYDTLRQWLWGMFLAMCLIGGTVWLGFTIIGLELALLMALLAFFFAFIPNIGPIIAGVPPILLGLLDSPQMALQVLLVYSIIQGIEGYVLTPLIFQKTVALPPALLLFFQVLLGIVQGGLGLFLAAPLLAVVMVIVQEVYIKDVLERPDSTKAAGAGDSTGTGTASS